MKNRQPTSHPLKWEELVHQVETMTDMDNPDIWIQDIRKCGPCTPEKTDTVCTGKMDETDCIEASVSVIHDHKNNRIIIRHHF